VDAEPAVWAFLSVSWVWACLWVVPSWACLSERAWAVRSVPEHPTYLSWRGFWACLGVWACLSLRWTCLSVPEPSLTWACLGRPAPAWACLSVPGCLLERVCAFLRRACLGAPEACSCLSCTEACLAERAGRAWAIADVPWACPEPWAYLACLRRTDIPVPPGAAWGCLPGPPGPAWACLRSLRGHVWAGWGFSNYQKNNIFITYGGIIYSI
jgi:hypothetical protein